MLLARPFGSLSAYLQAIGRGARPGEGKVCTVLDLMGAVHTHGLPDAPRTWHLEGEAVRLLDALPPCVMCRACLSWGTGGTCQICGAALPPRPSPQVRASDLIEIRSADSEDKKKATLRRYIVDAYARAVDGGKNGADAARSAWSGAHRYRGTYGVDPPKSWVLESIKAVERSSMQPPIEPGARFGSLVVVEQAENIDRHRAYRCKCDCGNTVVKRSNSLKDAKFCSNACQRNPEARASDQISIGI